MLPRTTLIAVLAGVELALVFAMVAAVGGVHPAQASRGLRQAPQSFPAGIRPALAIDVGMADVTIDAAPSSRIDVSVSDARMHVGSSAPIIARDDAGTIRIAAAETDVWSFLGDSRTIHIAVPPETAVTIAEAGDVSINGLRANATVASGAHFHSGDGITVRDFRGALTATSSNGVIDVANADCSDLRVTTGNGHIRLAHVKAARIDASSSNAGTSNGHISVAGFSAVPAKFVRSGDDDEDGDDGSPAAQTIRVGAGTGRLDVRAANGSIHLSQEG